MPEATAKLSGPSLLQRLVNRLLGERPMGLFFADPTAERKELPPRRILADGRQYVDPDYLIRTSEAKQLFRELKKIKLKGEKRNASRD